MTVTQARRHSTELITGRPESATKLVGKEWMAATARPTEDAFGTSMAPRGFFDPYTNS
jgi:hypothetical protein